MNLKIEADFRNLLEPLSDDEFAQLKANLKANPDGFPAIVVWKNYKTGNVIVDGHHQYKARIALGLPIKVKKLEFEDRQAAMLFALNCQLGRRNNDTTTLAKIASRLRTSAHLSVEKAAKQVGIGKRTLQQLESIERDGSAELKSAVDSRTVSIRDGAAILSKPKSEQTKLVREKKSGQRKSLSSTVSFDTKELDKKKSGKEVRPASAKKEAMSAYGTLLRALDKLRISADVETEMRTILRVIKEA